MDIDTLKEPALFLFSTDCHCPACCNGLRDARLGDKLCCGSRGWLLLGLRGDGNAYMERMRSD